MKKAQNQNQGTLDQLNAIQTEMLELSAQGVQIPDNIKLLNDPEQSRAWLETIRNTADENQRAMSDISELTEQEYNKKLREMTQLQGIKTDIEANMKPFNLKKAQQMMSPGEGLETPMDDFETPMDDLGAPTDYIEEPQENIDTSLEDLQLSSVDAFIDNFLDVSDYVTARSQVLENVPTEIGSTLDEILKTYYETDWDTVDDPRTKQIEMVIPVWEHLNPSVKADTAQSGVIENAPYSVVSFINNVTNSIKKLAESDSKKNRSSTFNLKKQAQAKTTENVMMYGPSEKRFDAFLRQPISDWHITERNKGFGLVVDDVWNIDWEAIWRGTIMDKYSKPYRDTKTGEWIGGYIQKRFEVDKWIPEGNNLQLLPGQKRKPYLPETRSTEARLEAMREKEGKARGYEPVTEGKPFNWKEAQAKKKKEKLAQFQDRNYADEYYADIKQLAQEAAQAGTDSSIIAASYVNEGKFGPEDIMFTIGGYAREDFDEEYGRPGDLEPSYRKPMDLNKQVMQAAIRKVSEDIDTEIEKLYDADQLETTASSKKKR